jgi:ketosteroid isomerase-like protein
MPYRSSLALASLTILLGACGPSAAPQIDREAERAAAEAVLDDLHRLASEGDFDAYFQLFAPDAVFMGTDATERWSVEEFRGYAAGSSGWTYGMTERHVFLDEAGGTAWFDERLQNDRFGETRGTGVLVRRPDGWKIAQYNLTIPVPNELAIDLVDRIRSMTR